MDTSDSDDCDSVMENGSDNDGDDEYEEDGDQDDDVHSAATLNLTRRVEDNKGSRQEDEESESGNSAAEPNEEEVQADDHDSSPWDSVDMESEEEVVSEAETEFLVDDGAASYLSPPPSDNGDGDAYPTPVPAASSSSPSSSSMDEVVFTGRLDCPFCRGDRADDEPGECPLCDGGLGNSF